MNLATRASHGIHALSARPLLVAPSILSADFARLGDE